MPPVWAAVSRLPGGLRIWQSVVAATRRFATRPGTSDEETFIQVVVRNEYRLPPAFQPDDLIVDVGAHIGCFSYAAMLRGARRVYAFEPDPANFAQASRNLRRFGDRVHLERSAVWRSDVVIPQLALGRVDTNLAGVSALWGGAASTGQSLAPAVRLDDVLQALTGGGRTRVRLLKIDCEAAEFPILLTAHRLDLVDEICGEYHELSGPYRPMPIPESFQVDGVEHFTILELTQALTAAGFEVKSSRHGQLNFGLFFASRSSEAKGSDAGPHK